MTTFCQNCYLNMENKIIFNLFNLEKKNILIIGGSGYLGFEMSKALLSVGANIIIAGRNKKNFYDKIKKSKLNLKKEKINFLKLDITKIKSVNSFYRIYKKKYNSRIDVLINCGWNGKKNTLESITPKDWDHDINVSLSSAFKFTKKMLPLIKPFKGKVINIASMYGHFAPDYKIYLGNNKLSNPPSYGAAKAGLIQLTKYLASYLSPYGITVNSISPGAFPFPITIKKYPKFIKELKKNLFLVGLATPKI